MITTRTMPALSLTVPWAIAMQMNMKTNETRSWTTKYRGPLAIHAAAGLATVGGQRGLQNLFRDPLWNDILRRGGYLVERGTPRPLPLGCVVAIVELYEIKRTEAVRDRISPTERALGDYSDGRYAWLTRDVQVLPEPIPYVGRLGLWECNLPL